MDSLILCPIRSRSNCENAANWWKISLPSGVPRSMGRSRIRIEAPMEDHVCSVVAASTMFLNPRSSLVNTTVSPPDRVSHSLRPLALRLSGRLPETSSST